MAPVLAACLCSLWHERYGIVGLTSLWTLQTSVNPNLPFFKKPGGADQKKDMNKALEPDPVSNSSSLSSGSLPTLTFRDSQGHQVGSFTYIFVSSCDMLCCLESYDGLVL